MQFFENETSKIIWLNSMLARSELSVRQLLITAFQFAPKAKSKSEINLCNVDTKLLQIRALVCATWEEGFSLDATQKLDGRNKFAQVEQVWF